MDHHLLHLSQGTRSEAEFAIEFRTLATESGWDQQALRTTFHHALSPEIKDELAFRDPAPDLESLIDVAIQVDHRLRERQQERQQETRFFESASTVKLPSSLSAPEEPMQLDGTRISQAERNRQIREKCCLYCGKPGHFPFACPKLSGKANSRPGGGGPGRE